MCDWSSDWCSSELRREKPELKLYLREETSHAAIESLRQGHVDCVLLALPFACGDVDSEMLFKDPLLSLFQRTTHAIRQPISCPKPLMKPVCCCLRTDRNSHV